jgi:hypothetical protein
LPARWPGPVGDLQLGQDVRDVIPYRLLAQPQLGGDCRVGPALRDQIQHFAAAAQDRAASVSQRAGIARTNRT